MKPGPISYDVISNTAIGAQVADEDGRLGGVQDWLPTLLID
jgi:hypothetical protein